MELFILKYIALALFFVFVWLFIDLAFKIDWSFKIDLSKTIF